VRRTSDQYNRDNSAARLAWIEICADILVHGKPIPLISTKSEGGGRAVFQKGYEGDLHSAVYNCKLHNADKSADGINSRPDRATDKDISTTSTPQKATNDEENKEEALHKSPPEQNIRVVYTHFHRVAAR
jgi:hypothetical protein